MDASRPSREPPSELHPFLDALAELIATQILQHPQELRDQNRLPVLREPYRVAAESAQLLCRSQAEI